MSAKDIVLQAVTAMFVHFDPEAAKPLLAEDYIQHNPLIPSGRAAVLETIPLIEEAGMQAEFHRVLAEDDLVVIHATYRNVPLVDAEAMVAFDVFRVEDGLVVEHWDNFQPEPEVTVSGRTMTDGATQITDLDRTAENKELVLGFVRDVLGGAAPEKVTDYMDPAIYAQHNPMIGDGLDGLMKAIADFAAAGQVITKFEPQFAVAEGNFVFVASDAIMGGDPWAFFDLWRVEDGKIVEHWDVVAPIPAEMAHDNGKF